MKLKADARQSSLYSSAPSTTTTTIPPAKIAGSPHQTHHTRIKLRRDCPSQPGSALWQHVIKEMYRGTSPVFDVPDFPALRRFKPLPKRRRTTQGNDAPHDIDTPIGEVDHRSATASLGIGLGLAMGLALPGGDITADELLAHADSLSAQMALQSYYMPILGGMQDLFKAELENSRPTLEFGAAEGVAGDARAQQGDEDDQEDGDYIDHLQQPGNTKKRKVPTNISRSRDAGRGSGQSGEEEESTTSIPTGPPEDDLANSLLPALVSPASLSTDSGGAGTLNSRKGKISPATLAGLQHKEMLKNRKRQLATVLGALSHGDTLALDQALSASFPFMAAAGFGDLRGAGPPKIRLSRRESPRRARTVRLLGNSTLARHPDAAPFPTCEFTFSYPSATSDRLVATKEEVTQLRARFEAELARQATKAAKLAAASKLMATLPSKGNRAKRSDRVRTSGTKAVVEGNENVDSSGTVPKARGKKKKRSALANASNPHHLKNYVPSRLPHSGQTTTQANHQSQNFPGPPPLRFLSAEIPPRRRKKGHVTPTAQPTNPMDEWVCPQCDYRLFYGDVQQYRMAVRMRKKILRRRRRARERAAAAANGSRLVDKTSSNQDESEDGVFELNGTSPVSKTATSTRVKGEGYRDAGRVGDPGSFG